MTSGIRRLESYPEYKDSGIKWLGEIPSHWEAKRVKTMLSRNDGGVWGDDFDDEGVVVLRSTEQTVDGDWTIIEPAKRRLSAHEYISAVLMEGDLVITKSSGSSLHIGKTSIVTEEVADLNCCYSNFMQRLRVKSAIEPRFMRYVLNGEIGRKQFNYLSSTTTGLANLNGEVIGNVVAAFPSQTEQCNIADFLDRETELIDSLIDKKERQIELLQEKRSALISHAVTKGLNPDAPMKDSGIEWLGEIASHWGVRLLKRVAETTYGMGGELDRTLEEGTRILSLPNVNKDGDLVLDEVPFATVPHESRADLLLQTGDLLFNWRNGSSDHLGKTAYFDLEGEYTHVSFLLRLRMNSEQHDSRYYQQLLNGLRITGFFSSSKAGVNNTFNQSELANLSIMVPPLEEQKLIADYLDEKTREIRSLSTIIEQSIEKLREYRTALISAAVTGKINVHEEVS